MYNLITRFFKFFQAGAHSFLDKFENPVNRAEQAIRDLKEDYDESMRGLAEIKALSISTKRQLEEKKQIALDYERKALILLQKAKAGQISQEEADRLASEALTKKNNALEDSVKLAESLKTNQVMEQKMEGKIVTLRNQIKKWESDITTMKARYKVAKSTRKINQQLVSMSNDSTVAMLENMKQKLDEEEALATAYDDMIYLESDVDKEINAAIGTSYSPDVQLSLAELKSKMLSDNKSTEAPQDNLADEKSQLDEN